MSTKKLTQSDLECLFFYKDGNLVRKVTVSHHGAKAGDIAGCLNRDGYLYTSISGKHYAIHRLIWLLLHGYTPENGLDHINRDKTDNRIKNLREISQQCNMRNTGNIKSNTSGVKGIHWSVKEGKWIARITVSGKTKTAGSYKDFSNAVCARLAAEQCLNWSGCDSSSPAFQYVHKEKPEKEKTQ